MKLIHYLFFLLSILWGSSALAQTVILEWDPNTDQHLAGYRIYYQAGISQPPFLGNEAIQGISPVDVGPVNSTNVTLPDDGKVYYFTVTAYDASGYESAYSNIIANHPRPALLEPGQGSSDIGSKVTFRWSHQSTDSNTTYTLVFGPESDFSATGFWNGGSKFDSPWLVTTYIFLVLLLVLMGRLRSLAWSKVLTVGLVTAFLVTACGGGGSDSSGDKPAGLDPDIPGVETRIVSVGSDQYYLATDLVPGKTYYWKVLAVDGQGAEIESEIFSFKTSL